MLISMINKRDFDGSMTLDGLTFRGCIAPDFTAKFDNSPAPLSLEELMDIWRHRTQICPGWYVEVLSVCSPTAELQSADEATVLMETRLLGVGIVGLYGMTEFKWRKEEGRWLIYSYTLIRAILRYYQLNVGICGEHLDHPKIDPRSSILERINYSKYACYL